MNSSQRINTCWKCSAPLDRPATEGRQTAVCRACGTAHVVVVMGERMIVAGLAQGRGAAASVAVRVLVLVALIVVAAVALTMCRSGG